MERVNIKAVFLFLIVYTSCLLINAGILNLTKNKFMTIKIICIKCKCSTIVHRTFPFQTTNVSIRNQQGSVETGKIKENVVKPLHRTNADWLVEFACQQVIFINKEACVLNTYSLFWDISNNLNLSYCSWSRWIPTRKPR